MAFKFTIGQAVKQVVVPFEGVVTEVSISGNDLIFKVEQTDANGDQRARFFKEDEIEAAPSQG